MEGSERRRCSQISSRCLERRVSRPLLVLYFLRAMCGNALSLALFFVLEAAVYSWAARMRVGVVTNGLPGCRRRCSTSSTGGRGHLLSPTGARVGISNAGPSQPTWASDQLSAFGTTRLRREPACAAARRGDAELTLGNAPLVDSLEEASRRGAASGHRGAGESGALEHAPRLARHVAVRRLRVLARGRLRHDAASKSSEALRLAITGDARTGAAVQTGGAGVLVEAI